MSSQFEFLAPKKREIAEALWSVYYHTEISNPVDLGRGLPAQLRPRRIDEALEQLMAPHDEHDEIRRSRCARRFKDAGLTDPARLREIFGAGMARLITPLVGMLIGDLEGGLGGFAHKLGKSISDLQGTIVDLVPDIPGRLPELPTLPDWGPGQPRLPEQLPILAASGAPVNGGSVGDLLANAAPSVQAPSKQPSEACHVTPHCSYALYDGPTFTTKAVAWVTVTRPLEDMVSALNPRNWQRCSDVIAKSEQVDPSGARIDAPGARGLPEDWSGHLLEEAVGGVGAFQQILNIDFFTKFGAPPAKASEPDERAEPDEYICTHYSLYDSLRCWMLGEELRGGIELNTGWVLATRSKKDAAHTDIWVTKAVRFSDLSPGRRRTSTDYGQILNLFAPAMLTLWADDQTQMNPCCEVTSP